jgi:hypothetical protein
MPRLITFGIGFAFGAIISIISPARNKKCDSPVERKAGAQPLKKVDKKSGCADLPTFFIPRQSAMVIID